MFITSEIIGEVERRFGRPEEVRLEYEMTRAEFDMVRSSQKNGRAHDVTLFIRLQDNIVVIRKPMYPPGAYRAPSGGVMPGERFEDGAAREALEETGLTVRLARYVLRARVRFTSGGGAIDWTTHVLTAFPALSVSDVEQVILTPIDTHEIAEARLATIDEMKGRIREALISSGSTGLRYRAELTDLVLRSIITAE